MILSDGDIVRRLKAGDLKIAPGIDYRLQLQPCSVDLRLSRSIAYYHKNFGVLDPATVDGEKELVQDVIPEGGFVLRPGDFILGSTYEDLEVPPDLLARVEGRSTYGRLGVTVHVTAGFIDPGFKGTITLEIANLGHRSVLLKTFDRVCQVCFERLSSPARVPYGHRLRSSKYQNQCGPTAPRPTLTDYVREVT